MFLWRLILFVSFTGLDDAAYGTQPSFKLSCLAPLAILAYRTLLCRTHSNIHKNCAAYTGAPTRRLGVEFMMGVG